MEWLIGKLQWLWKHPEVTWSGAGLTALAILAFLFKIPLVALFRRKGDNPYPPLHQDDLTACPPRLRQDLLRQFRKDLNDRLDSLLDGRIFLDLDKKLSRQEVLPSHHTLRDILHEQGDCAPQVRNGN
ncbi:MAG: hypothetical protein ACL93V_02590 [Candidatus Electrothrix sp. YB6]